MYGMVPYNLSPIQQGIQFGHAVVEYGLAYVNTKEYQKWANTDKTFIILNGGTTNNSLDLSRRGTLNQYYDEMSDMGFRVSGFNEPDLGDQLTAFVFLIDDRVFDRITWPDYSGGYYEGTKIPIAEEYYNWKMMFSDKEEIADKVIWARDFLKRFKLA